MIFSTIPQSENVIFILLYQILFSTVLGLPWWGEFQMEIDAQPLIYMHEWKKTSFTKMVLLSSLNDRLIMTFGQTNYVIKSRRRKTQHQAVPFKWDTLQDVV